MTALSPENLKDEIARIYGTPAVVIDLDKVEAQTLSVPDGVREFEDAELFARGSDDHAHFPCTDSPVDSNLV